MESRREFLRKAALLSGSAMWTSIPESILRALAIDPEIGTTYLDAEHIVILMQENRSFDHAFGSLQGVRGYNDPRAHVLADLRPVWLQTNADGETFAPFRLNIKETNVTWMGSLPHSWPNQVDARNDGQYDKWLTVKPSGYKGYEKKPMTLGHYTREDIPFYYAFADAFTICDQHFCSSLTGTTPNRLYLWTGTIRPEPRADSKPHLYNEEADHDSEVSWTTFPERLEDAGISWKIYQNELDIETGLPDLESEWLANFGDNPIEYFTQFNVRFASRHRAYLESRAKTLRHELGEGEAQNLKARDKKIAELKDVEDGLDRWTQSNFDRLSPRAKNLHAKAFCVNEGDPHFRGLDDLAYPDGAIERTLKVPKGDVFHQFRQDVRSGNLPTVSWIVGPEKFSDHPSSAWFGAWYVSEALDILAQNPEVWKKTIFILTYDENDGYFDHIPPFVAPNPHKPETGLVSEGIDASVEFVTREQDRAFRPSYSPRESSIGLGYRVPLVVASPWSRGGCVCSQVFDHTSVLQFLEHFLSHKTGEMIREPNISAWRRAVCGDLTSIFQPYHGGPPATPPFPPRDHFIEEIHRAKFKRSPTGFKALSAQEIEEIKRNPAASPDMPAQERGTRKSCPLPYELYADGRLSADRSKFEIRFMVGERAFGRRAAGSPFTVYAYRAPGRMEARSYALLPGKHLSDAWSVDDFEGGKYHVRVDGPNGFMREFRGIGDEPLVGVRLTYPRDRSGVPNGRIELGIVNHGQSEQSIEVRDLSYGGAARRKRVPGGGKATLVLDTPSSHGWYDFKIALSGADAYFRRFAGRVETGKWSVTDPAMGRIA